MFITEVRNRFRRMTWRTGIPFVMLCIIAGLATGTVVSKASAVTATDTSTAWAKATPASKSCLDSRPASRQAKRCKGGFSPGGPIGGAAIAGPNSGASWATNGGFGFILGGMTAVAASASISDFFTAAQTIDVPWPNRDAKRSKDKSTYAVYTLWAKKNGTLKPPRTWKYGITKTGAARPRSQLTGCSRHFTKVSQQHNGPKATCDWRWVRRGIDGWYKAREIEAVYAWRYKHYYGNCPPGMLKCL